MDKKWDVNPLKSLAGMKKPNDQAEATKVERKNFNVCIYLYTSWLKLVVNCFSCGFVLQDLEFTRGGDSIPSTPTTGLPMAEISEKLTDLIVGKKSDNETVFDWIESNVDEPTTKRPKFIRALMTAVCNSAIKGTCLVDQDTKVAIYLFLSCILLGMLKRHDVSTFPIVLTQNYTSGIV